jgi:hypothetical protein
VRFEFHLFCTSSTHFFAYRLAVVAPFGRSSFCSMFRGAPTQVKQPSF